MKKNVKNGLIGALTSLIIINRNKLPENNSKIVKKNTTTTETIINQIHRCGMDPNTLRRPAQRCWFKKQPFNMQTRTIPMSYMAHTNDYFILNPGKNNWRLWHINKGKHRFYFSNMNTGYMYKKNGVHIWALENNQTHYIYSRFLASEEAQQQWNLYKKRPNKEKSLARINIGGDKWKDIIVKKKN